MGIAGKLSGRILVVDDDETTCELLQSLLERDGAVVEAFTSPRRALERLLVADFDLVVTDLGMKEMGGIELCERSLEAQPDLPVLVVTGQGSMETAIGALRAGAYDFLTKPVDAKLLSIAVARALKHRRLSEEVKVLRRVVAAGTNPSSMIGHSSVMRDVYELIARVAESDASVLVQGETGTGKELVARAIHNGSPRKNGPFVAINCAAVPPTLIESELFGHARGAFTDAKTRRTGLFLDASGGTLFLDEIGELPLDMQAKLLRAFQERKVRPVGSNEEIAFDARIIAATNRDLEEEVENKRFRQDLFYRINVVKIVLPALRERESDVLELAHYFLDKLATRAGRPPLTLSAAVAEKLVAYDWPGNVRELENCAERAMALARSSEMSVADLPAKIGAYQPQRFVLAADDVTDVVSLAELEKRYVLRALTLMGGNRTRTATALGLDRRTLQRKLDRWGVAGESDLAPSP
jgi:two-component system response regulator HydG